MLRDSELDFLYTQEEINLIEKLKEDILDISVEYKIDKLSGKILYKFKDYNDTIKFFKDKKTFRFKGDRTKGFLYFRFWENGPPNNGMQFYTPESLWVWTSIVDFHKVLFGESNDIKYSVISKTTPETPKIKKPTDLRGIKQIISIPYIGNRARCGIFIKGNDVWVKHTDYLSPIIHIDDLSGTPISVRADYLGIKKPSKDFIYEDNWGAIVQKIQAWIKIENLYSRVEYDTRPSFLSNIIIEEMSKYEGIDIGHLSVSNMSRFWENVVKEVKKYKFNEGGICSG